MTIVSNAEHLKERPKQYVRTVNTLCLQLKLGNQPQQSLLVNWKRKYGSHKNIFFNKIMQVKQAAQTSYPRPLFSCQDRIPRQVRRMQPSKWQILGPFYCQRHERRQTKSLILQKEISKRRMTQNVLHGHTRLFYLFPPHIVYEKLNVLAL